MKNLNTIRAKDFYSVMIAAALWGTIGIATQTIHTVDHTSSLFISFLRTLIATPILFIISWRVLGRDLFRVSIRDAIMIAISGIFLALSQTAYFEGIKYAGITIATLLTICVSPIIVASFSVLLRIEILTNRKILAMLSALCGSMLLVGFVTNQSPTLLQGIWYSLLSAGLYAGVIISSKVLSDRCHPLQVISLGFCVGTILLAVLSVSIEPSSIQSIQGWLSVIYLGLVPSALGYWLFQRGLKSISATTASIITLLEPFVAALLAWFIYGETLSVLGLIGGFMLLGSIILLSVDTKLPES
ncbi:MAG: EamA family transporter [Phototrophicaceae bacterium]